MGRGATNFAAPLITLPLDLYLTKPRFLKSGILHLNLKMNHSFKFNDRPFGWEQIFQSQGIREKLPTKSYPLETGYLHADIPLSRSSRKDRYSIARKTDQQMDGPTERRTNPACDLLFICRKKNRKTDQQKDSNDESFLWYYSSEVQKRYLEGNAATTRQAIFSKDLEGNRQTAMRQHV